MSADEEAPRRTLAELGSVVPEWSIEQRWVLACQGILTELFQAHHGRMGGLPRPLASNVAALFLRRDWGVMSTRQARERLDWLLEDGHRVEYARRTSQPPEAFLGWDLVRAAAVAGWAYVAYYLEAEEAWTTMVRAARELQASFQGFAEVGVSYALGYEVWGGDQPGQIERLQGALLAAGGGWDLPWDADISGEIPVPTEPLLLFVVDHAGAPGTSRTIAEAMEAVEKTGVAARISVRPGT